MLKVKLVFVMENYLPHIGGAEVVFMNLSEGLAKMGHDVSIVTHRIKGTKEYEVIRGVKVYRVNCLDSRYLFTFLAVPKVLKIAKDADIIQTTTFNGAPPAWLAGKILRKPVVIMALEVWIGKWRKLTEMSWFSSMIHEFLERLIYLIKYDQYTPISESTKRQLIEIGVPSKKIDVIYCGLDYKHWNPREYDADKVRKKLGLEKNFVYVFYGRPGVSKGFEYLLKAVPLISKKIPNSKLLAIVSKDKQYEKRYNQMLKLIDKLCIKDKVIMHDSVPYKDLPAYVKMADVVVMPSLAEGFGFVAVETSAMGRPIVASDTTSLPEVVSGEHVMVKPKDVKGIAEGVYKVYKGEAPKSEIKRFTPEENIQKYLKVYRRILAER